MRLSWPLFVEADYSASTSAERGWLGGDWTNYWGATVAYDGSIFREGMFCPFYSW